MSDIINFSNATLGSAMVQAFGEQQFVVARKKNGDVSKSGSIAALIGAGSTKERGEVANAIYRKQWANNTFKPFISDLITTSGLLSKDFQLMTSQALNKENAIGIVHMALTKARNVMRAKGWNGETATEGEYIKGQKARMYFLCHEFLNEMQRQEEEKLAAMLANSKQEEVNE